MPVVEMKELFQKIDFFEGLDDKILRKVAEEAILRQYAKDEVVVRQGETGLGLYIIVRGRVKVDREQDGARVQVAELGPEEFFAEMSIIDNKPRSATVSTIEDTECLLLTRDRFIKLMNKYPELPIRVARLLADRLRAANEKLAAGPPPSPVEAPREAPAPISAAVPASNGKQAAAPSEQGTKAGVQDSLLRAFQSLFMMKAFVRFSVAVLGCPVEASSPKAAAEMRIGDVKALLLPADERVEVEIAGRGSGTFTLHVFEPMRTAPLRFGPVPVEADDKFQLVLEPRQARLSGRGRTIDAEPAEAR